jgi:hypothetical protein
LLEAFKSIEYHKNIAAENVRKNAHLFAPQLHPKMAQSPAREIRLSLFICCGDNFFAAKLKENGIQQIAGN